MTVGTIIVHWFLSIVLLVLVWRGEQWALYLTITLLAIACEAQSVAIDLLAKRKDGAK